MLKQQLQVNSSRLNLVARECSSAAGKVAVTARPGGRGRSAGVLAVKAAVAATGGRITTRLAGRALTTNGSATEYTSTDADAAGGVTDAGEQILEA